MHSWRSRGYARARDHDTSRARAATDRPPRGGRRRAGPAARRCRWSPTRRASGCCCAAGRARRRSGCSWPSATRRRRVGEAQLGRGEPPRHAIAQALLDRGLGPRAPAADPLGQRDRPRAADARRLPGRRPGRARLARLLADEPATTARSSTSPSWSSRGSSTPPTARPFGGVLEAVDFGGAELVLSRGAGATRFSELQATRATGAVEDALRRVDAGQRGQDPVHVGLDRAAQGRASTRTGCSCANQQSLAQIWPFTEVTPPVLVDWLPWNHTFGGNHNFNLILKRGGTLYIDAGRPGAAADRGSRCATSPRSRRRSTSTSPRATARCCRSWSATRRCARASSSAWT